MSIDDLTMVHDPHVRKPPVTDFATIARLVPDTIVAQILGYLSRPELKCFLRFKALCSNGRTVSEVANIVLYRDINADTPEAFERLRNGNPDPKVIACLVNALSIPGFTTQGNRDYVSTLLAYGPSIRRLCIGNQIDYPRLASLSTRYIPDVPKCHNIRSLTIGKPRRNPISAAEPFVDFKELAVFPNLTELRWITLDVRLGSVQQVLRDIHSHCPNLTILQAPWTNRLDQTSWSSLPNYTDLKRLDFRFDHGVRIDVQRMYEFLTEFRMRGIGVRLGDRNCMQDIVKWMPNLYETICREECARGETDCGMFEWLFQTNHHKLIKTTELDGRTTEKMLEALEKVDASDGDGLGIEIYLTRKPLPGFISPNVTHLRLLNDRQNIPAGTIPKIIARNPHLVELGVAVHVEHHGSSSYGTVTAAKVPVVPRQNAFRNSGDRRAGSLTTIPGFSIRLTLTRDERNAIKQQWRSDMFTQRCQRTTAKELPDLNIFNEAGWVPEEWTEDLLTRTRQWQDEVRGWLALNPALKKVYVILNTDRQTFGTFENKCPCQLI
jgi:hypothetical protein